ncbi:hypothetical protein RB195_022432 [Necator americanus]|uniref:Reverse transcriptase domain-containing protein n=1 Tax=Necator americanus TaxID=51031 RepID=A0ABR1EFB0_NECAM
MPLCLTFIDLKKAFDSVETEAVVEALDNQGVPTQHIKGDTISPKIFTATLEKAMRKSEWDAIGVKIDGRQLHHLCFADNIVLITPSISQAERMLTEFDGTCGCIGLQLNLQKKMFMRNGWVSDAPFKLNGMNISECTSYVYLGRGLNMMEDLTPELCRRRRAAWRAYKSIEDVVKKTWNTGLRAHLFNTTVLPALTYASETWEFRKQEENAVSVTERAIERVMLGVSCFTQVRDGIRSSLLRQRSKIRDAAFAKESKIRWAGHVMRFNDNRWTRAVSDWVPRDIKRTTGRPPTRWSDFFTKSFKEKYDALRVPRERRNHWATLARDRDKWKNYWRPLDQFEDQRESRKALYGSARKGGVAETEIIKRRLPPETLELIGQRGAAGNHKLTSELARLCRETIKEDLKETGAEVLAEAAKAGKSIRYVRREFANRKTRMTALRNPKGTTIASRRGMEKIIYDFYSDLFDSHVHLLPHHLSRDGHQRFSRPKYDMLSCRIFRQFSSTACETLHTLPVGIKVSKKWKTSKTVLLYNKGDPHDIGN